MLKIPPVTNLHGQQFSVLDLIITCDTDSIMNLIHLPHLGFSNHKCLMSHLFAITVIKMLFTQNHTTTIKDIMTPLTTTSRKLIGLLNLRVMTSMDPIHYSFAPLILFRVPYTLDLLP